MKLIIFILSFMTVSCASNSYSHTPLVMIHGAHFDERSFQALKDQLKSFKTYSINLFEVSENPETLSLEHYANRVCALLEKVGEKNAILLGHSQGGAVINQAFGICPERIKSLIFLAATIPFPDEKPFDLLESRDDEYYFSAIKENRSNGLFEVIDQQALLKGFAQDAGPNEKIYIQKIARHEPVLPSKQKLKYNIEKFQSINKTVILSSQDRILTPQTQLTYAKRLNNAEIIEIESGHLPMVTDTKELANILRGLIKMNSH